MFPLVGEPLLYHGHDPLKVRIPGHGRGQLGLAPRLVSGEPARHRAIECRQEFLFRPRRRHVVLELVDLGDADRDDRLSHRQVFTELDRVRVNHLRRQVVGNDRGGERLAVRGQRIVGTPPDEMKVGQLGNIAVWHRHAADHQEAPLRTLRRQPADQVELDPAFYQAEEADQRAGQLSDVGGRRQRRVLRLDEVIVVDAVRADVCVGVERPLAFQQRCRRDEHQVRLPRQRVVHQPHRGRVHVGQRRHSRRCSNRPKAARRAPATDARCGTTNQVIGFSTLVDAHQELQRRKHQMAVGGADDGEAMQRHLEQRLHGQPLGLWAGPAQRERHLVKSFLRSRPVPFGARSPGLST